MNSRLVSLVAVALIAASQLGVSHAQPPKGEVVLISQDEELDVFPHWSALRWHDQALVKKSDWVNGPPCFVPGDPNHHFLEADDNENPGQDGREHPWWGLFTHKGVWTGVKVRDEDAAHPAGTLTDPAGCAFDGAGNFFGVDVGEVHAPLVGDGQLIEFFAPDYTTFCRLKTNLSQPGMVSFDAEGKALYVPQAGMGIVTRYSDFPTDAAHCKAPTEDVWLVGPTAGIGTPIGITPAPASQGGGWAISSVLVTGSIVHVDKDGRLTGFYALPGPWTGTPFGLAFDSAGNLYFADLGVRPFPLNGAEDPSDPIGAADGESALKEVPAGAAPFPITIQSEMNFADGVAVVPASYIWS